MQIHACPIDDGTSYGYDQLPPALQRAVNMVGSAQRPRVVSSPNPAVPGTPHEDCTYGYDEVPPILQRALDAMPTEFKRSVPTLFLQLRRRYLAESNCLAPDTTARYYCALCDCGCDRVLFLCN